MAPIYRFRGQLDGTWYFYSRGYVYHLNRVYRPRNANGVRMYLRCAKHRRSQSCRGVLTAYVTEEGQVCVGQHSGHVCTPDPNVPLERELIQDILWDCRNGNFELPHVILNRHRARYGYFSGHKYVVPHVFRSNLY